MRTLAMLTCLALAACDGGETGDPVEADADTDADTDSDTDADTDSDTDADTDADTDVGTSFSEVNAVLAQKCGPCHTAGASGGHSMGSSNVADAYADSQLASTVVSGSTKGEAGLVRVQNGSMPQGVGCSGNPATDAANAGCLTQAEQDVYQAWVDDGQLP